MRFQPTPYPLPTTTAPVGQVATRAAAAAATAPTPQLVLGDHLCSRLLQRLSIRGDMHQRDTKGCGELKGKSAGESVDPPHKHTCHTHTNTHKHTAHTHATHTCHTHVHRHTDARRRTQTHPHAPTRTHTFSPFRSRPTPESSDTDCVAGGGGHIQASTHSGEAHTMRFRSCTGPAHASRPVAASAPNSRRAHACRGLPRPGQRQHTNLTHTKHTRTDQTRIVPLA